MTLGARLASVVLALGGCLLIWDCLKSGAPGAEDAGPVGERRPGDPNLVADGASTDSASKASDGGSDAHADACTSCASGACSDGGCDPAVFLTSKEYTGAIGDGGVAAADGECAALAAAAGLKGTFRAWIASGGGSAPNARFEHMSSRPYRLLDGRLVAADFAALKKTLQTAIGLTEKRTAISFAYVWTAADRDGKRRPDAGDCAGWTSAAAGIKGGSGESDDIVEEWTKFDDIACSTKARLYCFEQRP